MAWLLLLMLLGSCGALLLAVLAENGRGSLDARLEKHVRPADSSQGGVPVPFGELERQPSSWMAGLAGFGEKLAGTGKGREKLERLLVQSGWRRREALGLFMIVKTGLGLALLVLAAFSGDRAEISLGDVALCLGAYFAGGIIPEFVLKARAAKRYHAILRSMPDALDLMVICAEAGLPFPRIMKVVAKELELSSPVLAEELAVTSAELQLLPDRSNALRHLAERTGVSTVESMVATLIQAERYGTPLAQALHNIAAESRNTLILTLEEQAGKLPARLSIPLMTMILPPVVALVATPALMRVIRSLMS